MLIFDKHKDSYQVVGYKQFDTTEPLVARFLNNAKPIDLANYNIRFECLKPDGHIVVDNNNLTIKNTCEIEMMLDKQVTVVGGLLKCQFVLLRKSDGKQDTTFTFFIDVQKSAIDIERYSDSVITILENLNTSINEATQTNGTLTETNNQAKATDTELKATNQTATQTNNTLTNTNREALATNQTLTQTNQTATTTKNELNTLNTNATQTKEQLTQINTTATQTKNELNTLNTNAIQTKNDLNTLNTNATQTKNDLTAINGTATTTKNELTQINTTAENTNTILTQTNTIAEERKRELDQSIANAQNNVAQVTLEDFNGNSIPTNETKVRIKKNDGTYRVPVTRADAVYVNGNTTLDNALNEKVDKIGNKQLSTEDYTTTEKQKLAGIDENANNYIHPNTHPANIIVKTDGNTVQDFFDLGGTIGGDLALNNNKSFKADRILGMSSSNFYIGDGTGGTRIEADTLIRLYTSWVGSNDCGLYINPDGSMGIRSNNVIKHQFNADGTKTGGTMEIDGTVYGMSPTDSPQTLIEYIIPNVKVDKELKLQLDKIYIKMISYYVAFLSNKNIEIKEKGDDYITLVGNGVTDILIKGQRKEADEYFRIMSGLEHGNTKEQTL